MIGRAAGADDAVGPGSDGVGRAGRTTGRDASRDGVVGPDSDGLGHGASARRTAGHYASPDGVVGPHAGDAVGRDRDNVPGSDAGARPMTGRDTGAGPMTGRDTGPGRLTGRDPGADPHADHPGDATGRDADDRIAASGGGAVISWGAVGGEVLESGPGRPPKESGVRWTAGAARRWWRSTTAASPWRRRVSVAAAALAAAGAIVALRAGAPAPLDEEAAAAGTPAPVIIYGRARMQPPPFDRLPGRTPIPLPSPVGRPADVVRGPLPATGAAPGEMAARRAVRLVLGRYCRYPRAYYLQLEAGYGWRQVSAVVLPRGYVGARRLATLQLRWTGRSYAWQGRPAELARCA